MSTTHTYHPVRVSRTSTERAGAARVVGLVVAALAAIAFALYVALTLHTMSEQIAATNRGLAKTNVLLNGTNTRLRTTNGMLAITVTRLGRTTTLLSGTNTRLSGMAADLHLTVRGLTQTNAELRKTNATLAGMNAQMRAMARKIVHAKLLF